MTRSPNPSFAMLLQAVRPQPDMAEMRRLAAERMDWGALVMQARGHGVAPLLLRGLNLAGLPLPDGLQDIVAFVARRSLALTRELLNVTAALTQAGLPYLTFKGPTESLQAYGDLSLRSFQDIDLLVEPQAFNRACTVLQSLGYEVYGTSSQTHPVSATQILLRHRERRLLIDLHSHWTDFPNLFDWSFGDAFDSRIAVDVAGQPIYTLPDTERLLFLCLHGGLHIWGRLNWVCDLAWEFAHRDWDADILLPRAGQLGVQRTMMLGLALGQSLLGMSLSDGLAKSLPLGLRYLQHDIAALLESNPGQARRGRAHALLCHMLLRDSHRKRAVELRYRLRRNLDR